MKSFLKEDLLDRTNLWFMEIILTYKQKLKNAALSQTLPA